MQVPTILLASRKDSFLLWFTSSISFSFFVFVKTLGWSYDLIGCLHIDFTSRNLPSIVRVLFTAFGTCLSSSTGFSVVSTFLAFKAPRGRWDVLLDSLKTIADLHLLGRTELFFPQGWCYLLFCSQYQPTTPDNSSRSVESFMQVSSVFRRMKGLHVIDHSVTGSMITQPPESHPSVLRAASTASRWPHWGGCHPLQNCSRCILQLQPTERLCIGGILKS